MTHTQTETLRQSVAYEFKRRHYFKGGRFTPLDNVRDMIKIIRRMEGVNRAN